MFTSPKKKKKIKRKKNRVIFSTLKNENSKDTNKGVTCKHVLSCFYLKISVSRYLTFFLWLFNKLDRSFY